MKNPPAAEKRAKVRNCGGILKSWWLAKETLRERLPYGWQIESLEQPDDEISFASPQRRPPPMKSANAVADATLEAVYDRIGLVPRSH